MLQMTQTPQSNVQQLQSRFEESKAYTKHIKQQLQTAKAANNDYNAFMNKANGYSPPNSR